MTIANNKKIIVTSIVALVALIAVSALFFLGYRYYVNYQNSRPAITVNDQSINKKQYAQFKKDYEKTKSIVDEKNIGLNEYLKQSLVYRSAAQKYQVQPTNLEVNIASGANFAGINDVSAEWKNYVALTDVIKRKLNETKASKDVYAHLVFPFSRHFATGYSRTPIQDLGNPAKINEDKQYAQQQAELYFKQLKQDLNINNANKLVDKIYADNKLNFGYSGNISEVFSYYSDGSKTGAPQGQVFSNDNELSLIKNLKTDTGIIALNMPGISRLPGYTGSVDIAYHFYAKLQDRDSTPFNYEEFNKNAKVNIYVK